MEEITRLERMLGQQFGDAPREVAATIDLAMTALENNSLGEALNELNRAHSLIEKDKLNHLKAEMAAAWAVYYYRTGDMKMVRKAINYASKREPENRRIAELKKALKQ